MNLTQLAEAALEHDRGKHDLIVAAKELNFLTVESSMMLPGVLLPDGTSKIIEPWGLQQLCAKLGPVVFGKGSGKSLPYDYFSAVSSDLACHNLETHCQRSDARWMLRCHGERLRAVLDSKFPGGQVDGMFENRAYLEILRSFVDENEQATLLTSSHIDRDDLHLRIIWKSVNTPQDGIYGLGVYIGNSEVGRRKLQVLPLIQRTKCTNSIVGVAGDSLQLAHRGNYAAMRVMFKAAISSVLEGSAELLARMLKAEEQKIENFADTLAKLAKDYGWTAAVHDQVLIGSEGKETLAGIVNGMTYAAQKLDPNAQAELEQAAGKLLQKVVL